MMEIRPAFIRLGRTSAGWGVFGSLALVKGSVLLLEQAGVLPLDEAERLASRQGSQINPLSQDPLALGTGPQPFC